MDVALALTYHDPNGRLYDQIERVLPTFTAIFEGLAVQASDVAHERTLDLLARTGALIRQVRPDPSIGLRLGQVRRAAIELALDVGAPYVMYCDGDRLSHWAALHSAELARVVERIPERDFTVLGRTPRAFESHPRVQQDTERIVNHVYALISGQAWDVTAGARGLSRRAVGEILEGCPEDTIGVDVAWPLFLQRQGGYTLGYVAAEGLEFETVDRYRAQVAAAGSAAAWMGTIDRDPHRWAHRLGMARTEVEAMIPYASDGGLSGGT